VRGLKPAQSFDLAMMRREFALWMHDRRSNRCAGLMLRRGAAHLFHTVLPSIAIYDRNPKEKNETDTVHNIGRIL
jgi:hypothetical protein